MIKKADSLQIGLRPLLAKTLENALSHRIAKEFPRIGGPRICKLCAEMVMEVVNNHIRPLDSIHHGQIVWTAMDVNDRPGWCQKVADTNLVTVVLDASIDEDVKARMNHEPADRWRLRKAIRLCRQAYEQGGLLTIYDLCEILNYSDSMLGSLLKKYEYQTKKLVPRRGTIHDAGNALSHKWIICHKRYAEGKSADQIARETYHSLEAVDRYLGQFDRVRHCLKQGMDTNEIAHILNCGVSLVEVYRAIDTELDDKK
jgi:hypothetical protein